MQLRVGSYRFPFNAADVTRSIRGVTGERGSVTRYVHTLNVSGSLDGLTQAACSAQEALLQAALGRQYQDIVLLHDDGTPSATKLLNAGSISGVRVLALDFPNSYGGAEYATVRSFTFQATAEYLSGDDDTVRYTEAVTVTGTGGPVVRFRTPISGSPVRQVVSDRSTVRATQAGTWVGLETWPDYPPPLWPGFELGERRVRRKVAPRVGAGGFSEFETSWSYEFEGEGNFTGAGGPASPPEI